MQPDKRFLRFAAVCCFLTIITTLGIHLFFPDPPADFEQRSLMHKNTVYLVNRWWVIVHCLLVIISMWGFALVQWKDARGSIGLGFLFFAVFALAEITRQLFVLFYINDLREQYAAVTELSTKQNLRELLTYAGLLTAPLFGLFIFSFALGNLFYGISLWNETGFGRWLAAALLLWSVATFIVFANSFWKMENINKITATFNFTYQPLVRLLIGIWLWKKAKTLNEKNVRTSPLPDSYTMQVT